MKPKKFKEVNTIFAKDQEEYKDLPVFKDSDGVVVFCMSMTFRERLRALWSGNIWVSLMTFNKPLTPSFFSTKKSDVIITN